MTPAEQMKRLAGIWAIQFPALQERLERALALVGGVRLVSEEGSARSVFVVEGVGDDYLVTVDHGARVSRCTCEDSRRGNKCKHRLACALVFAVHGKKGDPLKRGPVQATLPGMKDPFARIKR